MKNIAVLFIAVTATAASAQPGPDQSTECCAQTEKQVAQAPVAPPIAPVEQVDDGWRRPPGQRFLHGIRIGWTYVMNFEEANRPGDREGEMQSLKDKYDLKTPHMMLLGYEGMYRATPTRSVTRGSTS